jgi:hypothetical protein
VAAAARRLTAAQSPRREQIASWLNQVEVWFSILERATLRGASHTSPAQVRSAIERFATAYNETAAPFDWQKREVHQVTLSKHYADLRN